VDELSDLKVVGKVARNSVEEVVVQSGTYWNIEVIDIRWNKNGNPSHKGIRLNKEEAREILNILRRELE
jgi:hypothetical protein|tara:strand:+ start:273 stop:479 length:207 start_codon:yes stop_codon:yes gene_type:complete